MRVVHGLGVTWRLFTVGENGKQNSGMVNFYPKSSLPFAQFSFEKRPRKPETGVKDGFEDLEHHNRIFDTFMSLVHSLQDHEGPALQRFCCFRESFHRNDPNRDVFFLLSNRTFHNTFVHGKQSLCSRL